MNHPVSILSALTALGVGLGSLVTPSTAMPNLTNVNSIVDSDVVEINHRNGFVRRDDGVYLNGHRGHRKYRDGYRRANGMWFPAEAFIGALIINGIIQSQPRMYGGNAHVRYCLNRYRSYDISSDTYQPNRGGRRYCNSPYN